MKKTNIRNFDFERMDNLILHLKNKWTKFWQTVSFKMFKFNSKTILLIELWNTHRLKNATSLNVLKQHVTTSLPTVQAKFKIYLCNTYFSKTNVENRDLQTWSNADWQPMPILRTRSATNNWKNTNRHGHGFHVWTLNFQR